MIREATECDIPRIVEMGVRFWKEGPYSEEHVRPEIASAFAHSLILSSSGRILVAEVNEIVVGVLAFVVFPHFFTGELTATETIWFVEPEHRRISSWPDGSIAMQLLSQAEDAARSMGAVKMQFTAPTSPVGNIYKRIGYKEMEVGYQRNLN